MKKSLLLLLLLLIPSVSSAIEIEVKQDTTKSRDYKLWFMGRVDLYAFMDTQRGVEVCGGVQYVIPGMPTIDASGNYVNGYGALNFNIAASRFGMGGSMNLGDGGSLMGYVEADFLGQMSSSTLAFRLRHAYAKYTVGRSSLLFGQTTHLALDEALASPTVTFGAGYPFSALSRPVQFRYTYNFEEYVAIDMAASIFWGSEYQAQTASMIPDFSARVRLGNPKGTSVSITAGIKTLDPSLGVEPTTSKVSALYAGVMAKLALGGGYNLRGGILYGEDPTTLGMLGGVALKADNMGYTPISTLSSYFDFETARYGNFAFGLFVGHQQNLGSLSPITLAADPLYQSSVAGADSQWRVAPRLWYSVVGGLSFGLEYMYAEAEWMESWDENYQSVKNLPTSRNNRITLLARFVF